MNKKIKIGIDIDDCISNTLEMDFACAYYKYKKENCLPTNIDRTNFDVTKSFNMKDGDNFYIQEKKYIMKNNVMYPKIFAKEVVEKLKQKGFEIYIITSRKDMYWNGNSFKFAKRWLRKNRIKYNKLFNAVANKANLCEELKIDYMIEDSKNHIKQINEKGIKSILLKTEYNKDYSNNLNIFCDNWLDIYVELGKIFNFDSSDIISF